MTLDQLAYALRGMPREAPILIQLPDGRLVEIARVRPQHVLAQEGAIEGTSSARRVHLRDRAGPRRGVKLPVPLSEQRRAFHADQAQYHRRLARDHARRGHDGAALRHQQAAEAHEAAAGTPLDDRVVRAAMRASAMADEASQRVGVRPLLP